MNIPDVDIEQEKLLGSEMKDILKNFQGLNDDNKAYRLYNFSGSWIHHDAFQVAKNENTNLTEDTNSGIYWRWIYVEGLYDKTN